MLPWQGVSTRTHITSEGATWASEAPFDFVSRDAGKAVEAPKLPLRAGHPLPKDQFLIMQMGMGFSSVSCARAW